MHVSDVFHKPLLSHRTSQQTNILISAAGNAKNIFETITIIISSRVSLLIKIFIHTYNHSFTVLSAKSTNTVSLPWKLSDFLDTSFSWTLSFPLGPYFSFLWGPLSFTLLQFVGLHPTVNSVDLRTRLPGCVDHQVCSTYVSTPKGQPSGPGPGCYL